MGTVPFVSAQQNPVAVHEVINKPGQLFLLDYCDQCKRRKWFAFTGLKKMRFYSDTTPNELPQYLFDSIRER
jgi:hypothetical protein